MSIWGKNTSAFKGWYATPTALRAAWPVAQNGDSAIVGSTDTVWVWDSGTVDWKDSGLGSLVTSVFGRTAAVAAQSGDYTPAQVGAEAANANIQSHVTGTGSPHTPAGIGAEPADANIQAHVTGTGSPHTPAGVGALAIASNLSDVNNVATSRANLGLASMLADTIDTVTGATATYTCATIQTVHVNTSVDVAMSLPDPATGLKVFFVKLLADVIVTVTPAAGTIDGAATFVISGKQSAMEFYHDGANWHSRINRQMKKSVSTVFTSGGTITIPAWCKSIGLQMMSAGAGGVSGRKGAAGLARAGGGGGAAGGMWSGVYNRTLFTAADITIAIGAGGTGGASITASDTNGTAGTEGGDTSATCGTFFAAPDGGNSGGVASATASAGGAAGGNKYGLANAGGAANITTGLGANGAVVGGQQSAGGGAAGGSITAADVAGAGGIGGTGSRRYMSSAAGGTGGAAGVAGGDGTSQTANKYLGGGGGGGGGASITGNAGAGGNGGLYGAGGGGGGAALNAVGNSGKGGDGGGGIAVVTFFNTLDSREDVVV
jgi:hypothetical protein